MNGKLAALFAPVIQAALLATHPVGSIHIRVDEINPSQLFGGVWERYAQGRVMIGADGAHPLGAVGGEETHTLTTAEMPTHNHYIWGSSTTPGNNLAGGIMITSQNLYDYGCLLYTSPSPRD